MSRLNLKAKLAKAGALAATAAMAGAAIFASAAPSAHADPQQYKALVGVGSDTIQDISNALSGYTYGKNFTPIQSDLDGTDKTQIVSFDAFNDQVTATDRCISPKLKSGTIYRSNGSSEGRRALSRAIDGGLYGPGPLCGAAAASTSGLIDYARSSASPSGTGTDLTYIPMGRDGVSFAYYRASGGAPVTDLTRAQLTSLFTTGPQTINGVNVIPCGIQLGSGTKGFWDTVTTATAAQEDAATAQCRALVGTLNGSTFSGDANGRLEENKADQLKAKGDAAPAGSEVVIGFSAAKFISYSNGVAQPYLATGVDLGTISDNGSGVNLGKPYAGTAPNLTPNNTFYSDATFGRRVYYVVDTGRLNGFGDLGLKGLFVTTGATSTIPGVPANHTAVMCQSAAQAIVNSFGFETPPDCGTTTITGPLLTGTY